MRICDWSSDVCSSDLLLAQDSPLSTSGFPSGREQSDNSMVDITIAAWRACFEDPTLTADADFLQLGGDSLAAVHIGLHLEEVLGWPVSPDEIFACRTPQILARRFRRAKRSEENTSELQSLMRTSYAVFCLKK